MNRFVRFLLFLVVVVRTALAADSVVVFNEIHYHPPTNELANEWVELHNQMAVDIDLSAWSITGEIGFTFAEGTIIPGGGYVVIASDPAALQAGTGATNIVGPFNGRLNNSSAVIRLRDRNDRLMDEIEYRDGGKWPVAPDGSGATLAKRDQNSISRSPENWTSSVRSGGTPGTRNFPARDSVLRRSLVNFNSLWRFEASGTDLGTTWRDPGFNDSSWAGRNNATLLSYWPFDGNATATRGVNGTFVGAIGATTDRNGVAGGALAFNGALQQYVSVAGGGGLNGAGAGTISMWVKWTGTQDTGFGGAAGAVLGRQQNGVFSGNIINLNNANPDSAIVQWRHSAAGTINVASTSIASNNVWRHIAVTFNQAGSQMFLDGVFQGAGTGGGLQDSPTTVLAIGGWIGDGGSYATAAIDDVAIWDQPLTAAQIGQLAAQSKTPLDFAAPESAVYYAGDGRLTSNDELRRTALPLGATTYYFRNTFQSVDEPAQTELKLDFAVDDGAVFYLNGAEVYRHNMSGGAVNYSTFAASAVGDASIVPGITLPPTNLVRGTNTLAVEVHQAGAGDAGMVFGAGLTANVIPVAPVEERLLISRNDVWKFDASNTDLGTAWRLPQYNDDSWVSGAALFFGGSGEVDDVPPERITTISAMASTEFTADGRLAVNAINGSGLVGNAHVNTPGGTMWLNNGTFAAPNDLNPQITFDLGAVAPLRWLKVWNYNEDIPGRPELLSRGVASGDILVGVTSGALSNLVTGQSFNKGPGAQTDFSQTIDLGGVSARYLRLDKLTNFPGGDFRFVGLSEAQVFRDPDLKRTQLPLGPTTSYFRKAFSFTGDPANAALFLDTAVDDGAVFYLNGVEIYRFNMPTGIILHSTVVAPRPHATFTGLIAVSSASLVRGTNVFAVEVHQSSLSDPDMIFGATLTARVAPPAPEQFAPGALVFNEVSAASTNGFQIELMNAGTQAVNVAGYVVQRTGSSPDARHALASQIILPGQFLALNQGTLGFGAVPGDKLFLLLPNNRGVADSIEVHERSRGRSPDGSGEWMTPTALTIGASNTFLLPHDIVINEIMYHAPPTLAVPGVLGTNVIITFSNLWRYEQSGTDLGAAWLAPDYDDSGWAAGNGLFYNTTAGLPAPKNTPLTLGPNTFYFRTTFVYTGTPAILSMNLRHLVDDGSVLYLNGVEINRFNMPAGPITYTNNSTQPRGTASLQVAGAVSITNLVLGTNVLAAEVHQTSATNLLSDVVFGAELTAVVDAVPRIPFSESPEQWVELFNRGANSVNLAGWRLDEGIDFRFPSNTVIPSGGYLVAAKDPPTLASRFPGITIVGPYTNSLSHRGERIVLKDANDNPADAVHYFDDGRWPGAADAGGASLELRDPWADNSAGEAWAASNESSRSSWRTYSYRGVAAASPVGPDGQWREFVMGLLDNGVVLLDDIMVIETPNTTPTNLIQNGTFDTGTNKWRIIGNHHGEVIDDPDQPGNKVLRLVANGSTDHMSNHGETTLAGGRDTVNGREYLISFRAKWISGSRQFHTRLYFNRLPRTTLLDAPMLHGTPGSQNSAFSTNIGPTYAGLRHEPAVPAAFAPVTVSVQAGDPDSLSAMTLWWRTDGGVWASAPMALNPESSTPDYSSYSASIPGKAAGTVVQFYIEGADGMGARSVFPADGTNSRALFQFDDGLAATNGLHNVRLVALAADADQLFRTVNLMSNERIGCTVIYDEREIFYEVGLRLKGSEHSRTTTPRLGFNVSFASEQLFRGVHTTVAIDRSESTGFGQREMLIHQMLNHAGEVPTKYHDLIQVMAPRSAYTGSAELQLARYSDVFLDDQFDNGSDGTVFEYELVYQLNPPTDNGTPEGNKVPNPDSVVGTTIRNLGDDKEFYRWNFLIKNNEERDDYNLLIPFAKAMELTGTNFFAQITNIIVVDQWLRGIAVNTLAGCGDSYGGDGAQHNVQFYARPDGKMIYFPHDLDAFFNATRGIVPNADVTKLIAEPAYARAYYCHLLDIIATTYNGTYMTRWAEHFKRLLPAQDFAGHLAFIVQRANFVTGQVNATVPNVAFAITSNSGNNFGTTNDTIALTGTAPLSVKEIEINGVSYPITWTSTTAWSVRIPLLNGLNALVAQGVNNAGLRISNATDTIIVTNSGPGSPFPVVINEWMADNAGPFGFADPADGQFQDWFELFNPNTNAVNLAGFYLTDDLAAPTKWQIPFGSVIAPRGFLLVWADGQPQQNGNTNGHLHAAFQLNNSGEDIGLFTPGGVAQHVITFGGQFQNVSQGLFPDGQTNALYFMTNWTPRAANTLSGPLRLTGISLGSGVLTLIWNSIPGRVYRVEFKDNLNAPAWTPLGDVPATGTTASTTDAIASNGRFYRVGQLEQ